MHVLKGKPYLSVETSGVTQICVLYHLWKRSENLHCLSVSTGVRLSKAGLTMALNVILQDPQGSCNSGKLTNKTQNNNKWFLINLYEFFISSLHCLVIGKMFSLTNLSFILWTIANNKVSTRFLVNFCLENLCKNGLLCGEKGCRIMFCVFLFVFSKLVSKVFKYFFFTVSL